MGLGQVVHPCIDRLVWWNRLDLKFIYRKLAMLTILSKRLQFPSFLSVHSLHKIAGSMPIIPDIWVPATTPVNRPRQPDHWRDLAKAKVSVAFGSIVGAAIGRTRVDA